MTGSTTRVLGSRTTDLVSRLCGEVQLRYDNTRAEGFIPRIRQQTEGCMQSREAGPQYTLLMTIIQIT